MSNFSVLYVYVLLCIFHVLPLGVIHSMMMMMICHISCVH